MLRTRKVYQHHVDSLSGPLHEHSAAVYGMWRNSELNHLKYFHVTEGMVPDVMHDIFEGTLEICIRCLLLHLVSIKALSLEVLNNHIRVFSYGVDTRNKPSEIVHLAADKMIKQSGTYTRLVYMVIKY